MKNDKLSRVFISKKTSYACFKIAFTINHYTERKLFLINVLNMETVKSSKM